MLWTFFFLCDIVFIEWKMIMMVRHVVDLEKRKFTASETILLVIMSLLIGVAIGGLLSKTNIITKKTIVSDENLQELIDNYQYILNNYYQEIDKTEMVNSAIEGMMESLDDPYSLYFDAKESENFSITLDGSYEGIGVQIVKDDESGNILITSVFKNSPAANAGLKSGDEILEIDGLSSNNYDAEEFSNLIKNSEKENFELKILRENQELSITLYRSVVVLDSVTSEMYEQNGKKIGYIYIGIFANNTYSQFKEQLEKLEKEKIDSLIIDVRSNTGGHLTAVDNILDIFLTNKQKMYGFEQNGKTTYAYGTGDDTKDYEIVLLGDESSASASEVLISSLSENLGAKFFGKKTYGKGTVQELVTLSDGTQYKLTIKKWLTPKGNWVNDTEGIIPDKEVELDEKYFENLSEEYDSQLNYAIKYLCE